MGEKGNPLCTSTLEIHPRLGIGPGGQGTELDDSEAQVHVSLPACQTPCYWPPSGTNSALQQVRQVSSPPFPNLWGKCVLFLTENLTETKTKEKLEVQVGLSPSERPFQGLLSAKQKNLRDLLQRGATEPHTIGRSIKSCKQKPLKSHFYSWCSCA